MTLGAGPELDAEVATKVMGWTVYHYSKGQPGYFMLLDGDGNNVHLFENPVGWATEQIMWDHCPKFSSDIAAAWQIVEKLHLWVLPGDNGGWCAGRMDPDSYLAPYIDTVGGRVDGAFDVIECGAGAPEAICRAALAAVSRPAASSGAASPADQD